MKILFKKQLNSYYSKIHTYFVVISVICILILGVLLSCYFLIKLNRTTSDYNESLMENAQIEIQKTVENVHSSATQIGINKLVNKYLNSSEEVDYMEINDINLLVMDLVAANDYLESAYIIYPDRNMAITSYGMYSLDFFPDKAWMQSATEQNQKFTWLGKRTVEKNRISSISANVVTLIGKLPYYKSYTSGYIVINVKESFMSDKLSSVQFGNGGVFIQDMNGCFISGSKGLNASILQNQNLQSYGEVEVRGLIVPVDEQLAVVNISNSPLTSWRYVAYTPINLFFQDIFISTIIILVFVLAVIFISFVMSYLFSNRIYLPIQNLMEHTNHFKREDLASDANYLEFKQINTNVNNVIKEKEQLQQQILAALPSLKEKFFLELISGQILVESYIDEYMKFLDIDYLKYRKFVIVTLWIDHYESLSQQLSSEEKILCTMVIKHHAQTLCTERDMFCCCIDQNPKTISIAIGLTEAQGMHAKILEIGNFILQFVRGSFNFTITMGVGHSVDELISLQISANQALDALEQSSIYGNDQVIFYRNIEKDSLGGYINPLTYEKVLTTAIKNSNREEIIRILTDMKNLIYRSHYKLKVIRQFYLNILNMIFILEHELSADPEQSSYQLNFLVSEIYKKDTLCEIYEIIENVCLNISAKQFEQHSLKAKMVVEEILKYLKNNYNREISLDDVSENVSYTPAYINKILKMNLNKTFYDILTDIRIDKAKELLTQSETPIYQISEKIGYINVQSFIRMFKKTVGVTPGKYRDETQTTYLADMKG